MCGILLRGDAHFANVELMQLALDDPYTDFLFGLTGNSRLKALAEPHLQSTRRLHDTCCHNARLWLNRFQLSNVHHNRIGHQATESPSIAFQN
jgi:hypothetical protein